MYAWPTIGRLYSFENCNQFTAVYRPSLPTTAAIRTRVLHKCWLRGLSFFSNNAIRTRVLHKCRLQRVVSRPLALLKLFSPADVLVQVTSVQGTTSLCCYTAQTGPCSFIQVLKGHVCIRGLIGTYLYVSLIHYQRSEYTRTDVSTHVSTCKYDRHLNCHMVLTN